MSLAIAIPARFASTRFPGKPLALIHGVSLLERVCRIALACKPDVVVVATEHESIAEEARRIGVTPVFTSEQCENGTERVLEALQNLGWNGDFVINLQGDAALTPPWVLRAIIEEHHKFPDLPVITAATELQGENYEKFRAIKQLGEVGGTTVVFDRNRNALYFSKTLIPFLRSPIEGVPPAYRHIGIYGYRYDFLKRYVTLAPGQLERMEGLEQLRALEHGTPIRLVIVDYRGRSHASVDAPTDVARVEEIISREGELL